LIWRECRVPEGTVSEFSWEPHVLKLQDKMGFDHVHPCFFPNRLLSGGSGVKLCYMLPSFDISFSFHGKSKVENDMKAEI
jgi:hypothetical protein